MRTETNLLTRRDLLARGGAAVGLVALGAQCVAEATSDAPRTAAADPPQPLSRIAFGSCLARSDGGSILDQIADMDPGLMLWLGDNIYADTEDMSVMRRKYDVLAGNPRFQRLRARCPNLAIWDDHDYGQNNAGSEYRMREASREVFLDFWGEPAGSPRRARPGVYHAATFGPPGQRVQIVMVDVRYNRGDRGDGTRPGAVLLGEEQWAWLDATLAEPADVRLIASGIQILNTATNDPENENWGWFPRERARLFDLVRAHRAAGTVFLSGDMHYAELSVAPGAIGCDAVELTSSGLDVSWGRLEANPFRAGDALLTPGPEGRVDGNFGCVEIDWRGPDTVIALQAFRGGRTRAGIRRELRLADLQAA